MPKQIVQYAVRKCIRDLRAGHMERWSWKNYFRSVLHRKLSFDFWRLGKESYGLFYDNFMVLFILLELDGPLPLCRISATTFFKMHSLSFHRRKKVVLPFRATYKSSWSNKRSNVLLKDSKVTEQDYQFSSTWVTPIIFSHPATFTTVVLSCLFLLQPIKYPNVL